MSRAKPNCIATWKDTKTGMTGTIEYFSLSRVGCIRNLTNAHDTVIRVLGEEARTKVIIHTEEKEEDLTHDL